VVILILGRNEWEKEHRKDKSTIILGLKCSVEYSEVVQKMLQIVQSTIIST
jgi:hypothetical protein